VRHGLRAVVLLRERRLREDAAAVLQVRRVRVVRRLQLGVRDGEGQIQEEGLAAMALQEFEKFDSHAGAKRNIRDAIQKVAARLGNTPTICRKCYIHPEIITTYIEGSLLLGIKNKVDEELRDDLAALRPEEAAVLTLLRNRLSLTLKDKLESSLKAA